MTNIIAFPDTDDLVAWCRENPEETATLIERSIRALRTLTKAPRDAERETIEREEMAYQLFKYLDWRGVRKDRDDFVRTQWQELPDENSTGPCNIDCSCDHAFYGRNHFREFADHILALPSIPPREGPVQSTTEQADASRDHPVREPSRDARALSRPVEAGEDDCSCGGGNISGHDVLCPYASPPPASQGERG